MILRTKSITKIDFLLFSLLYIFASVPIFMFTTGGYSTIILLMVMGVFYPVAYIIACVFCINLTRVRFSPFLVYCVLATQSIAVLFNIGDEGYYGFTCRTKNFIQYFFDHSNSCGKLWISIENYPWVLSLYGVMVIIFLFNILWLRANHTSNHRKTKK
jgi:hypothetical protein